MALDDTYTDKLYADYIEVPLLLKLRMPLAGHPALRLRRADRRLQAPGEAGVERRGDPARPESILKNNDYGAIFGAGLNLGPELHGRRPLQPGPAEGHLHVRGRRPSRTSRTASGRRASASPSEPARSTRRRREHRGPENCARSADVQIDVVLLARSRPRPFRSGPVSPPSRGWRSCGRRPGSSAAAGPRGWGRIRAFDSGRR